MIGQEGGAEWSAGQAWSNAGSWVLDESGSILQRLWSSGAKRVAQCRLKSGCREGGHNLNLLRSMQSGGHEGCNVGGRCCASQPGPVQVGTGTLKLSDETCGAKGGEQSILKEFGYRRRGNTGSCLWGKDLTAPSGGRLREWRRRTRMQECTPACSFAMLDCPCGAHLRKARTPHCIAPAKPPPCLAQAKPQGPHTGRAGPGSVLPTPLTRQRVGAEAAEHYAVHGADARARQHRDGQLQHHGHVDGHAVTRPDPLCLQPVRLRVVRTCAWPATVGLRLTGALANLGPCLYTHSMAGQVCWQTPTRSPDTHEEPCLHC